MLLLYRRFSFVLVGPLPLGLQIDFLGGTTEAQLTPFPCRLLEDFEGTPKILNPGPESPN